MLRLLSWSSGLAADKITAPEMNHFLPQPRHIAPTIDLQKPTTLKRKRVDSPILDLSLQPSKRRIDGTSRLFAVPKPIPSQPTFSVTPQIKDQHTQPARALSPAKAVQDPAAPRALMPDKPTIGAETHQETLRQVLDTQIGLEILLKHNELRQIDQEIAKCQIALEQLRRCSTIPFPINGPSVAVSQGRGPAVRSSRSLTQVASPAPWGVTDGPYSRHYAKWLLPDPFFDGGEVPNSTNTPLKGLDEKTLASGRSTRGSFADPGPAASKARVQRAGKFQALSSGYPQPKDKSGPMIQKRKSDGAVVKLLCLDCRRDNFSSAQGFINHCRIAHNRNFASHDAAADACGEPVEVDEAGGPVLSESSGTLSVGLVHPLIYSAQVRNSEAGPGTPLPKSASTSVYSERSPSEPRPNKPADQRSTEDLTPSPVTPHLSAFLQRTGAKLDLQSLVSDTRSPVAVDEPESDGEEEGTDSLELPSYGSHPCPVGSIQPMRSVPSTTTIDDRAGGLKSPNCSRGLQPASGFAMTTNSPVAPKRMELPPYVPATLGNETEPSPTNESNQAPSLVDDDGEEDCEVHSPFYPGSSSSDGEMRDVDVDIEDGDDGGPSTRDPPPDSDFSGTPKKPPTPAASQPASALRRSIGGREAKHVSFLSPGPGCDAGTDSGREGGDGSRKRTEDG